MTTPIDYAALRVQVELKLRAVRRGEATADAATIELGDRAVDIGTRDLILEAATALGLVAEQSAPATEEPPAARSDGPDGPAE